MSKVLAGKKDMQSRYAWSPVGLDVPVSVYDAVANSTYYYHTDANKNVTELNNASGSVVAHYEYSPFGKVVVSTGSYANTNPFRFSSEYHDDETGLVYYNYRYYSPELGRWLSRDPIEEQGGVNLYGMVGNSPLIFFDYFGRELQASAFVVLLSGIENSNWMGKLFHHADIGEMQDSQNINILRIGLGGGTGRILGKIGITDEYIIDPLTKRIDGNLRWGDSAKTPCKCVTSEDIRNCIRNAHSPFKHLRKSEPPAQSCQTDVYYIVTGCCLSGYKTISLLLHSPVYDYEGNREKVYQCIKRKYSSMSLLQKMFVDFSLLEALCEQEVMAGYYENAE